MKLRNPLMSVAIALLVPMTALNVGCGAEEPDETDDVGTSNPDAGTTNGDDAGTNGDDDAGTNGGEDAGTDEADAGTDDEDAGTDDEDAGTDETDAGQQPDDESRIWFYGDYKVDNKYSVGVHEHPEGTTTDLAFDELGASRAVQWDVAPDGSKVALVGAKTVSGRQDVLLLNGDGSGLATLVAMPSTDGSQDASEVAFSPDGTQVSFRASYAAPGLVDAFVVPTAGGTPVQISPARPAASATDTTLGAVAMRWSPSGRYVAVVGDLNVNRANELYIADLSGATPTIVTAVPVSEIGDVSALTGNNVAGVAHHLAWSLDDRLIFKLRKADQDNHGLYSVKPDGTELERVAQSPDETVDVGAFAVSPDGKRLAYSADAISAGAYETYMLPLDGSASAERISSGSVGDGRSVFVSGMRWSPDSSMLAFIADYDAGAVGHFDLYVSSPQGPSVRLVAVGDTDDSGVDVEDGFAWAPDASGIVFAADHRSRNDVEVFRTTDLITADQTPLLVQGVTSGGDVSSAVFWTP